MSSRIAGVKVRCSLVVDDHGLRSLIEDGVADAAGVAEASRLEQALPEDPRVMRLGSLSCCFQRGVEPCPAAPAATPAG